MKSQLMLKIDNTHPKVLGVRDVSVYNPDIAVCEPYLVVQAPGFTTAYTLDFSINNYTAINSNSLGLTKASNVQSMVDLPDGIYYLKYSIQPHDTVFVEYTFFRTAALRCRLQQAIVTVDMSLCENYENSINTDLKQLMIAEFHLRSAEANINDVKSNELLANKHYAKAQEIIDKILTGCSYGV